MHVLFGKRTAVRADFVIPATGGGIVVGSGVNHAVAGIGVGQIVAGLSGIESKLQHLHARITGIHQKLSHRIGEES